MTATALPAVRVLWRPEQFNRVTNPGFETDASGWSASAGINAAGTSRTRITTDAQSGSACLSVVCGTSDGGGVNYDFGSDRFFKESDYGAIYVALVWLKRVSGSRRARVILGSEGTSSDRATLTITDLTDQWQPYVVRWLPSGNRTDVQLAITNGSAEALTVRVDSVSVYQVDAFSQVENGTFQVDTTGWTGYLSGAIARSTSSPFGGTACARITSSTTSNSGAYYTLPTRTFVSGRTYRFRVAVKYISGATDAWTIYFYDATGAATKATASFTPTASWAYQTLDWTCDTDYTSVEIGFAHGAASASVLAIDEVEVYEALDDLGTDAGDLSWSRTLGEIGGASIELDNRTGRYDPLNASSVLYGSVLPGKRVSIRTVYAETLYACFHGTISTVEPRPLAGKVDLLCEDMMATLRDADVSFDFTQDDSYFYARKGAVTAALTGIPVETSNPLYTDTRISLATGGMEGVLFFNGTDGNQPVLDYLNDLNEATQSVHWCRPVERANIGWRYVTQDRATFTDTTSDFTIDESDPASSITGVRFTNEALENRVEVPWQTYERLPPSGADPSGYGYVMLAYDPDTYAPLGSGEEAPYLIFTREEYGTDDDHPDARWRYGGLGKKKWRRWKKRGRKVPRKTRVYPDAFVPKTFLAGDVRRLVLDFAIPVSGPQVQIDGTNIANLLVDYIEQRPQRLIIELRAIGSAKLTFFAVVGTPWQPQDEETEVTNLWDSQLASGLRQSDVSTPYVPSRALAAGVGAYRAWRYGTAKVRPTITDRNVFPRTLTCDLTDHITVTADRWNLSAVPMVVTGATWSVTQGGTDWTVTRQLEQLPSHTAWLTLDDAAAGLDDAVVLAY